MSSSWYIKVELWNVVINSANQTFSADFAMGDQYPADLATVDKKGNIKIKKKGNKNDDSPEVRISWSLIKCEYTFSTAGDAITVKKKKGDQSVAAEFSDLELSEDASTASITDADDPKNKYEYTLALNNECTLDPRIYNRPI